METREKSGDSDRVPDDFVILSRGSAAEALTWTKVAMARLGLTVNEAKTSLKNARQERCDFLGYSFGPHRYKANGLWYQLAHVANEAKAALDVEKLDAVADRGYFNSEEILTCEEAGITVTLPKPMTSNSKAEGRFGKQDFRYMAEEDFYVCPAGEKLAYHYTTEEKGLVLRRYWTNACQSCAIKNSCTTGKQRRTTPLGERARYRYSAAPAR